MTATIEDVARQAEVSVATVSRALRGLPNVAPSTRARVQQVAEQLHYVADPHASRLAARRSRSVGVVVPMLGQWYYSQVFSGVEAVLAASGYDLLPYVVTGPAATARFSSQQPFRKRVDGLVLVDVPFTDDEMDALVASGTTIVTVGRIHTASSSLAVDNVAGARTAVEHLLALGHRRIGLIGGDRDDPFHFSTPLDRRAGYDAALAARGIASDDALVVPGNFSLRGGAEAMTTLLALAEPPTAVFAMSDEMAIGGIQTAREAGLRVPEDLSVIGFDDHDVSAFVGLTTIRQAVAEAAERAAQMAIDRIEDPAPRGPRHDLLPTELVVRESTGPARP